MSPVVRCSELIDLQLQGKDENLAKVSEQPINEKSNKFFSKM